jgi:PASTA domain
MSARLAAVLLALAAIVGATGALTYAADQKLATAKKRDVVAHAKVARPTMIVPDVTRQPYVFAKGILVDAGFAWRVVGSVQGYAVNTVASQSPAPGTRVVDTGAPTIELTLSKNARYKPAGEPEVTAPYPGTPLRFADLALGTSTPTPKPRTKSHATTKPKPAKVAAYLGGASP